MTNKYSTSILFHADVWGVLNDIRREEDNTVSRLVNEAVRFFASELYGYTAEEMKALGDDLSGGAA